MLFRDYWDWWLETHPNFTEKQKKDYRKILAKGCVGVTLLNLGAREIDQLITNCYASKWHAEQQMKSIKCSDGEPRLYSIHLWTDGEGLPLKNWKQSLSWWKWLQSVFSHNGRVDLRDWYNEGFPLTKGKGFTNYDFGFVCDNGTILHADQFDNPDIDPRDNRGDFRADKDIHDANLFGKSLLEWQNSFPDFDTEVWCVRCQKRFAKCR